MARPGGLGYLLALFMRPELVCATGSYFGVGYFDSGTKSNMWKVLTAEQNETDGISLDQKYTRVKGSPDFQWSYMQDNVPRTDAIQETFFTWYNLSLDCLAGSMQPSKVKDAAPYLQCTDTSLKDHFVVLTLDGGRHPDYAAQDLYPEVTVKLVFIEEEPPDPTKDQQFFHLTGYGHTPEIKYSMVITSKNESKHTVTWGMQNYTDGSLVQNKTCVKQLKHLYVGVLCIDGFQTPKPEAQWNSLKPGIDDGKFYCPYTLTFRRVLQKLTDGATVVSLIGPGQWQAFQIDLGTYDHLDIEITRNEFDNLTYPLTINDGWTGQVWLAPTMCPPTNVGRFLVDTCPYQPYSPGEEGKEHRFCSLYSNHTYNFTVNETLYIRNLHIQPDTGAQDDLGYKANLQQIKYWEDKLELEMDYPEQRSIQSRLLFLRAEKNRLDFRNAQWLRHWRMRMCTGPGEDKTYWVILYADHGMSESQHNGQYTIKVTHTTFSMAPLASNQNRRGCLKRGGQKQFSLRSQGKDDASMGSLEVKPYFYDSPDNHVSVMYVAHDAESGVANATNYDAVAVYPSTKVSLSPCNAEQGGTWSIALYLNEDHPTEDVFFELKGDTEDSTLRLDSTISASACCHTYKYYVFEGVPEDKALSVYLNVTQGVIKAVYWKFGSCPKEAVDVEGELCTGWCELQWYRIFTGNLGKLYYRTDGLLRVPLGIGEEPDKRRAGKWYLGIQALDGFAQYTFTTRLVGLPQIDTKCTRYDRFCHQVVEDRTGVLPYIDYYQKNEYIQQQDKEKAEAEARAQEQGVQSPAPKALSGIITLMLQMLACACLALTTTC